jgi:hypothetical protein
MDNSPALALNAPQSMVNLSYRAIMPQDGLLENIAITSHSPWFPANKRRKLVRTPGYVNNPPSSPSLGFPVVDYFRFARDSGTVAKVSGMVHIARLAADHSWWVRQSGWELTSEEVLCA